MGAFHLMPLMLYKWEGSQFSAPFFSILFHSKISSLPFHWGVSSDLNVLKFWKSHFIFLLQVSFHLPSMRLILSHLDLSSNEALLDKHCGR